MDSFCLTRDDYKDFLNHMLNDKTLNNENLAYYIERAKEYFDCNIVGSNYYLSIIIEQMLKSDELDSSFLDSVYSLCEEMFFSIEEHGHEFVRELYDNHFPEAYYRHRFEYNMAIQMKDEKKIELLKSQFGEPFEEDLNRILNGYYETKVRY